jgi:hypothetical protein
VPAVLPAIVRRAGGVPFFLVSYAEQVSGGGQGGAPLEARLLAEDGPDGYRFTHDLIRETVENGLSAIADTPPSKNQRDQIR